VWIVTSDARRATGESEHREASAEDSIPPARVGRSWI
jgi:hypothetical protein